MSLNNQELETVLRCVDRVFDFSAERDRLRKVLAWLEAENKTLRARVAELEARCKRLEEAGDRLAAFTPPSSDRFGAWSKAKEAKP